MDAANASPDSSRLARLRPRCRALPLHVLATQTDKIDRKMDGGYGGQHSRALRVQGAETNDPLKMFDGQVELTDKIPDPTAEMKRHGQVGIQFWGLVY